jgi:hypothetical protein
MIIIRRAKTAPPAPAGGGGGAEATVLIDDSAAPITASNAANSSGGFLRPGFTGTTNLVMLVGLAFANDASGVDTSPTMVWDFTSIGGSPQTMTLLSGYTIIGSPSNSDVYFFGLVNPNQGTTQVIRPTWTGSANQAIIFGLTAYNADQTGGTTTFTNYATGSGSGSPSSVTNTAPATRLTMMTSVVPTNFSTANGTAIGTFNASAVSAVAAQFATALSPLTYTNGGSAWLANSISIKGH